MGKLCTDQLIRELVALLRETDQESFDDAVARAKNQFMAENGLGKLFDAQIATLKGRGTPGQIVEILQNQKGLVLAKANKMTFGNGNIPFLPVILPTFRGLYDLMATVRNGRKAGYTHLDPTAIRDLVDAPKKPYYMYDIENGNGTRGESPDNAEKTLKQQGRSPLTAAEVVNLCILTGVLSKHYVWALGSRYASAAEVPIVGLDRDARPRLAREYVGASDDHCGSASCGSR